MNGNVTGLPAAPNFPGRFSAWLGKKVKAEMEGHVLPRISLSRNISLQDFQHRSKRCESKVFMFVCFFPPTERLEHSVEKEPWKQQDMWMEVFHKIFYTLMHLIRHLIH